MKTLKQYDLRIIGQDGKYPYHDVAFMLEQLINQMGKVLINGKEVPLRVHIFDKGDEMLNYELGHAPEELLQ